MKKFLAVFLSAAAIASRAALPQPDLIARIHFAGGDAVAADKNYSAFTDEFSSAEALALRRQVANRLTPWLAGWLQANVGAGVAPQNLRPLLDDLQNSEWYFEARTIAGKPSGMFAIKLGPARSQLWKTSLKPLPFGFSSSADWFFFAFGSLAANAAELRPPVPMKGWLDCEVNWPELARWYPGVKALDLPEMNFSITGGSGQIRIIGKLYSPQNLSLRLDPWKLPTTELHEPLASLTAMRGFAPWLAGQDWARAWQLSPPANQLFIWALNGPPFQTFAAAPVNDPATGLHQLYHQLQPVLSTENARGRFLSKLGLTQTNDDLAITNAPIIRPQIKAENGPAGAFLFASGFPNPPGGKPLPPELLQTFSQPNLIYYHWEVPSARLPALLEYSELALLITKHRQLHGTTAAYKWMKKASSLPGYTATEITQTGPDQMTFVRSAPAGLTAFEMVALASWLDAPDFPGWNLELPPVPAH